MRGLARGQTVVCIPVFGALDLFDECLRSVLEHTPADVPILVADDGTPDAGVADRVARAAADGRRVEHLRQEVNRGFVENVNAALAATAPADVTVLNSDCVVFAGWLDGLLAAAATDSRIATVSALANHATILSVPVEDGRDDAGVAAAIRAGSLRLVPRIPTAIGHLFLVRRAALDLVGDLDTAFSPGYGEEVDFSQRCLMHGLIHVAADDVWVRHRGEGSFSERAAELRDEHERLVEQRYPWYTGAVRRSREGALGHALGAARRSLRPVSVTVDGSALGARTMGTQVTTLALVRALVDHTDARVRVALPPSPGAHALSVLGALGVDTVPVGDPGMRTDIVHRPAQVVAPVNLDWLHALGERIVITHQDLIAYANPSYFGSYEDWDEHRSLTRQSLALADAAVFISSYVRDEALADELVAADRAILVAQGVDHSSFGGAAVRPDGVPDGAFIVLLGADFRHKNRVFAMRMAGALRSGGWHGTLVLAGPEVEHGSSRADEEALGLDGVVRLGEVSEAEKAWLYANASLALYPTLSEGFGLVPFEAATFGTACMFAPVSSLVEIIGEELATLEPWDAEASAARALELLGSDADRRALAEGIAERGRSYTWSATAHRLVDVYGEVLSRPARAALLGDQTLADTGRALVGPGGYLPPDVQRALLAISTRPALRGPAFAALRASYRALKRARGD